MKIVCEQRDLAKAISIAGRAVAPRSTLPILGNLLLAAKGGELHISATNMAMRIDCAVPCKVEAEGAITVPARLFIDMIGKLPSAAVTLELIVRTMSLGIQCGSYKAKINGIDAEDFPARVTDTAQETTATVALNAPSLRQMIDQVAFAASSDTARTTLTGVEVSIGGRRVAMAATDGFRLAMRGADLAVGLDEATTIIVPSASLNELARILAAVDSQPDASMTIYERHVTFDVAGDDSVKAVGLTCSTIDARFPDYDAIVPKSHKTTLTTDTKALLRSLQMARMFASQEANRIQLTVDTQAATLAVRATNAQIGDSDDTLQVTASGEPVTTYVDVAFMIDVLSRIESATVDLLFNEADRPLVIRPSGMAAEDFTHVIMPMSGSAR